MLRFAITFALLCASLFAQVVTVDNYGQRAFKSWVRGTTLETTAATPRRTGPWLLVPGRQVCDGVRMLWVRHDSGIPVGCSRIELADAAQVGFTPTPLPAIRTLLETRGVPSVNGVGLALVQVTPDGPGWQCHFRARSGMFVYDLDVPIIADQGWSPFVLSMTHSDVTQPTLFSDGPAPRLAFGTIENPTLGLPFFWIAPTALRYGPDQSQRWVGVAYWEAVQHQGAGIDAPHQVWTPLSLWDSRHATQTPPFGETALLPPTYRGQSQWLQHSGTMRTLAGTWNESPLGVAMQAGRTGETDGHSQDGHACAARDTAKMVLLIVEAARLQGRRPDDRREHDGSVLDLAKHPNLRTWANIPWAAAQSDMLGKASYPPNWDIPGTAFPADQQHHIQWPLAVGYRLSGDPDLARTIHANLVNLITRVRQDMSARAVGWVMHASAVLDRSCPDQQMRLRLKAANESHWSGIAQECSRPATHPGWWHSVRNASRFDGHAYVPVWEHALAAGGLSAYWLTFGDERARLLAVQAGLFTVRHGWTETGLSIDSLEIAPDGVTFARSEAFNTYWSWMTWGACAVLKCGAQDPRVTLADRAKAQQIVDRTAAAYSSSGQPRKWTFR